MTDQAGADDFVDDSVEWKSPSVRSSCQMIELEWNENRLSHFHELDMDTLVDLVRWTANHTENVARKGQIGLEVAKEWSWTKECTEGTRHIEFARVEVLRG
ncbi:MAG: hypothetical protein M1493_16745 [Firmicutes bacterium]|nr:hypothetical protein [Bacillota bacterium]